MYFGSYDNIVNTEVQPYSEDKKQQRLKKPIEIKNN